MQTSVINFSWTKLHIWLDHRLITQLGGEQRTPGDYPHSGQCWSSLCSPRGQGESVKYYSCLFHLWAGAGTKEGALSNGNTWKINTTQCTEWLLLLVIQWSVQLEMDSHCLEMTKPNRVNSRGQRTKSQGNFIRCFICLIDRHIWWWQ